MSAFVPLERNGAPLSPAFLARRAELFGGAVGPEKRHGGAYDKRQ